MRKESEIRHGFSLIEVVLAIGLSTVLLALLASAINLFLLRVDASGEGVRQAQLARSVLRLVANDLRAAATPYEQDASAAISLAQTQSTFDVDELDDIGQSEAVVPESTRRVMGLYGDSVSLSLDVNRARPIDPLIEFGSGETQASPEVLSGVTTVRYFVTSEGLTRQEARRDIDVYEYDQGGSPTLEASSRVIAPEVAAIQFTYSDGEQTLSAWNSEEQEGALPVAVEVVITFRSPATNGEENSAEQLTPHRMVIALPSAILPEVPAAGEEETL